MFYVTKRNKETIHLNSVPGTQLNPFFLLLPNQSKMDRKREDSSKKSINEHASNPKSFESKTNHISNAIALPCIFIRLWWFYEHFSHFSFNSVITNTERCFHRNMHKTTTEEFTSHFFYDSNEIELNE